MGGTTHAIRSINFFSSPKLTTRPYSVSWRILTFSIWDLSSSSRRSRWEVRSKRGSSVRESSRAESESVGEGGELGFVSWIL